jgi:D-alanyl-D-alanine dipeptidase
MGGGHDLMDKLSHHGAQGITSAEAESRRRLCCVMRNSGFDSYDREWWHYTLKHEPYPNTYFDFPVS